MRRAVLVASRHVLSRNVPRMVAATRTHAAALSLLARAPPALPPGSRRCSVLLTTINFIFFAFWHMSP